MTPALFAALAVAGGVGSACRFVLDGLIRSRFGDVGGGFPWGTVCLNVTGSFALGLLTGLVAAHAVAEPWRLVVGVGFLGGYTTFSTASYETVRLAQQGRWLASLLNGLGVLLLAGAAAAVGLWLGGIG